MTWKEPPKDQQNGDIIAYNVYVYDSSAESAETSPLNITVESSSLEANITGLSPYTDYNVLVSASTEDGEGPTAGVTVRTAEDSRETHAVRGKCFR